MRAFGIAVVVFLLAGINQAAAFSYYPTRLVLTDRQRTGIINIINKSEEASRFTLQWRRLKMTKESGLTRLKEGESLPDNIEPADDFVLYAPRQAMVPPNNNQVVRFMARPPRDLPDGEYRSHLVITDTPDDLGDNDRQEQTSGTRVLRVPQTTIPIIVRVGDLTLDVGVKNASLGRENGSPVLNVTLRREGSKSLYGDVEIVWRGDDGGELILNQINAVAIYPELNERSWTHTLTLPNRDTLPAGTVHYMVREHTDEDDAQGKLLAETKLRVR